MNKQDIQTKIDVIIENLEKLHILRSKSYEEFASDFRNIDSALHRLQTSIQALLDIGSYIIASLGLKTPNTNAEIIEILKGAGYIPEDKAKIYIRMTQFRNRIVHLYNRIDTEILYEILTNELEDIKFVTIQVGTKAQSSKGTKSRELKRMSCSTSHKMFTKTVFG